MNTISFLFCAHMFAGKRASQIFTLEAEQGPGRHLLELHMLRDKIITSSKNRIWSFHCPGKWHMSNLTIEKTLIEFLGPRSADLGSTPGL
jgi:hypothetical protein